MEEDKRRCEAAHYIIQWLAPFVRIHIWNGAVIKKLKNNQYSSSWKTTQTLEVVRDWGRVERKRSDLLQLTVCLVETVLLQCAIGKSQQYTARIHTYLCWWFGLRKLVNLLSGLCGEESEERICGDQQIRSLSNHFQARKSIIRVRTTQFRLDLAKLLSRCSVDAQNEIAVDPMRWCANSEQL